MKNQSIVMLLVAVALLNVSHGLMWNGTLGARQLLSFDETFSPFGGVEEIEYIYSKEFIIMFNEYYDQSEHGDLLSGVFRGVSGLGEHQYRWSVKKRDNPGAEYPSDFALVLIEFNDSDFLKNKLIKKIERDNLIRFIVPDRLITNPLQEWEHQMSEEEMISGQRKMNEMSGRIHSEIPVPGIHYDQSRFEFKKDGEREYTTSRQLRFTEEDPQVTQLFQTEYLWENGITGKGIKVAIFDTGLNKSNHHFNNVKEYIDWTNENVTDDRLGHGTFVAGVIASNSECFGFAPDSELFIYKVFTRSKVSLTSWFLDAFNYALVTKVDILNLSIGGPDFLDLPFVEKVRELSANGIQVVSAIGNDGPLYGTLNNPADQLDVIGVGGIDRDERVADFSSRGMTIWEMPMGYGRVKPDVVTYGKRVKGVSAHGCKELSGTSVSSPVVAGAVALIMSSLNSNESIGKSPLINPGSIKQVILETSDRIPDANIFEQGSGKLNLQNAYKAMQEYSPKVSFMPSYIDMTECPYFWPYCSQEMYYSDIPVILNLTIINGISVSSEIRSAPIWRPGANGQHLHFEFKYNRKLWPWSGHLGVYARVKESAKDFSGIAEGSIEVKVTSYTLEGKKSSIVRFPVKIPIIPTPPREKRILWDQYHNIKYPSGFIPSDYIEKDDPFDWNGDHLHTNFKKLYTELRAAGYYIETSGSPLSCFNPEHYGTLLIVDPEEEFHPLEIKKIEYDVRNMGLNLIVFAEWFNTEIFNKQKFFDKNSGQPWIPATGGSNIPSLNDLLSLFGIYLGDTVHGDGTESSSSFSINGSKSVVHSASSIIGFPKDGKIFESTLVDFTRNIINGLTGFRKVPILGFYKPSTTDNEHSSDSSSSSQESGSSSSIEYRSGHVVVFTDTACIDDKKEFFDQEGKSLNCFWMLKDILAATLENNGDSEESIMKRFPELKKLKKPLLPLSSTERNTLEIPKRGDEQIEQMRKHSKTMSEHYIPTCSYSEPYRWKNQDQYEKLTWSKRNKIVPSLQVPMLINFGHNFSDSLKNEYLIPVIGLLLVGVFLTYVFFTKDRFRKFNRRFNRIDGGDGSTSVQINETTIETTNPIDTISTPSTPPNESISRESTQPLLGRSVSDV